MAQPRRTQEERSSATRAAITVAARKLFAAEGFAAASIEQILQEAGVTRGAFYHHFDSKTALFVTVFEAVEADLAGRLATAAAQHTAPWDQLMAGAESFLTACLDPEIRRIVLLDAPAALGMEEVRRIEDAYTMAGLRSVLGACAREGDLDAAQVPMLTHLILGALAQAAVAIARAEDPVAAREAAWTAAQSLLTGLRRR